jgi:hypothetical protein
MAKEDNLKSYKKGESGNPNGRPKGVPNSKTRLLRLLEITQNVKNPITGELEDFSIAERMDLAILNKALKGDIRAYQELMDRLEGKAVQSTEIKQETTFKSLDINIIDTGIPLASSEKDIVD